MGADYVKATDTAIATNGEGKKQINDKKKKLWCMGARE